jgi:amino acid transporter/mannitol/fructose-specific phosphotransferase system IIA component (Ntr-type)
MKLKKKLTLIDIFSVATGAMISSGIFILPGLAFSNAGPSVFVSYMFAGILAYTGMLSQAELVSAMPKAGGTYFYVTRSMGPAIGTVDGLLTWFSLSLKSAFALVGMGAFVNLLVSIDIRYIALILCVLFVTINLFGIKEAARIQVTIVSILLAIMIYYISRGIPAVSIQRFEPFIPYGIKGIISTTGIVFISFGGLLKVAALAEEVKSPGRTIPLAMILSLFITSIIYTLAVFVTTGVLDARVLQSSLTPLTEGARAFGGTFGLVALSIGAILAFVSTANAGIMAASRYPLALSRDALLPEFLSKINRRFNTPHVSIVMTGGFMIIAIFLKLTILVKAASTVMILTYMFSCLSIIILRESRLQNYQPSFKAPLYPWLQIAGIAGFIIMIYGMGKESFIVSSCLIVGGLFVYWFYGRIRATREFALLYLIQRITAKELVSRTLESELKEIIRERDEIIKDRFDTLIEGCSIIDIEKPLDASKLFSIAANSMSKKLGVKSEYLLSLLNEREIESSTAITPYLAIPHIIIQGEKIFDIFLVRCKGGIYFNRESSNVHAVFILVGTKDERNFHLRALSAIAQIVHDPNFENRWLGAKNEEDLRDIVLLGKRKRSDLL